MSASRANRVAPLCKEGFTKVTKLRASAGASIADQSSGEGIPSVCRPMRSR